MPHPVALIGCRTTEMSLDCCEYDLAVFAPGENRVVQVDGHVVELLHFERPAKNHAAELAGMSILKETSKLALSSAVEQVVRKHQKALRAAGKKLLIDSLFCQQKMCHAKQPSIAAMWLKIAAYYFVDGALSISGRLPMPLHEMEQVRQSDDLEEGVEIALECIGMERATRPTILRSIQAVKELKSKDYDNQLFASKVNHLLEKSMLADCYYYAGKIAAKTLARRNDLFYSRYAKLVQLAQDLSNDLQHLERLQKKLFRAAKGSLG